MKRKMLVILLAAAMAVPPLGTIESVAAEQTVVQEEVSDEIVTGEYAVPGTNIVLSYEDNTAGIEITGCNWDAEGELIISELINGKMVTGIADGAFSECSSLTDIKLPETVTKIDYAMFYNCHSLSGIKLPKTLEKISSYAFEGCSNLKDIYYAGTEEQWNMVEIGDDNDPLLNASVHFESLETEEYTIIASTGKGGSVLPSGEIDVKEGDDLEFTITADTGYVIGDVLVDGVSVGDIPWDTQTWQYICENITEEHTIEFKFAMQGEFFVPETNIALSYLEMDDVIVITGRNDDAKGKLVISEINGKKVTGIKNRKFYRCENLTSIELPESIRVIEDTTFLGCKNLTNIKLPEELKSIGAGAFSECSSLTSIKLPETLTDIGWGAFAHCTALKDIYYAGTEEQWNAINIDDENDVILNAIIHFESSEKEEYVVTVGDAEIARGSYNTKVTVPAPTVSEGQKFVGWREAGTEKILSTKEDYTFYIARSIELEPIFAAEDAEIAEVLEAMMSSVAVTKRADGKSDLKFVGQLVIPEGYILKDAGLVWSSVDGTELALDNSAVKVTHIKAISDTCQFSVTIKGVPKGRFVRGKIFATVQKDDAQTIYSPEEKTFAAQ